MASLSESDKRDFVAQIKGRLSENSELLTEKGFNPENKVSELTQQSEVAQTDETAQQKARRAAEAATKVSSASLKVAYDNASASVDLVVGLLGKDHPLSQQLRKLRN